MQDFNLAQYLQSIGMSNPFMAHNYAGRFGPSPMGSYAPQFQPNSGYNPANFFNPFNPGVAPAQSTPPATAAGPLNQLSNQLWSAQAPGSRWVPPPSLDDHRGRPDPRLQPQAGVAPMPQQPAYSPMPMAQPVAQPAAPLPQQTVPRLIR